MKIQTVGKYLQHVQYIRQVAKEQEQSLGGPYGMEFEQKNTPIWKKWWNHRRALSVIPSHLRSIEWLTVSKAALISYSVSRVTWPWLMAWKTSIISNPSFIERCLHLLTSSPLLSEYELMIVGYYRSRFRAPYHVIQAIAGEGLAQGPCVVAWVGFEPSILWTKGDELTTEQ